ncbi:MAG: PucR family transcriptional regulator [Coriobacteriales bacterium]
MILGEGEWSEPPAGESIAGINQGPWDSFLVIVPRETFGSDSEIEGEDTSLDMLAGIQNILLVGDFPSWFEGNGCSTLATYHGNLNAEELCRQINDEIISYSNWYEEAMRAVLDHVDVQTFLDVCSRKLKNPVALFDNGMSVMAISGEFIGSIEGTIWEQVRSGTQDLGFYSPKEQELYASAIMHPTHPYIMHPTSDPTHAYLASHVLVEGQLAGSLGLVDINAPISQGQIEVFALITSLLDDYLRNNRSYLRVATASDNVVSLLLDGEPVSNDAVSMRLAEKGWDEPDSFVIALLRSALPEDQEAQLFPLARRIGEGPVKTMLCKHGEEIVAVFDVTKSGRRCFEDSLSRCLPEEGVSCGISSAFSGFSNLIFCHGQALFAVGQAEPGGSPVEFRECQGMQILAQLGQGGSLAGLCDGLVWSLWNRGNPKQKELVRCLATYLDEGGNISSASRKLQIHRNTLVYRISLLSQLLGMDVSSMDDDARHYYLDSCRIAMAPNANPTSKS